MRTFYETPEMEIVKFEAEDVITTSGLTNGGTGDGGTIDWSELFPSNS